jgi:hypothetical protein
VHRVRREEVFVRPKKGQDEVNFESDESLSIVTETETGDGEGQSSGWETEFYNSFISAKRYWIVQFGIRSILIGCILSYETTN